MHLVWENGWIKWLTVSQTRWHPNKLTLTILLLPDADATICLLKKYFQNFLRGACPHSPCKQGPAALAVRAYFLSYLLLQPSFLCTQTHFDWAVIVSWAIKCSTYFAWLVFKWSYSFFVVVELPDEPDGKKFEVFFEREGQVEASTQTTRPVTVIFNASYNHCQLLSRRVNPCSCSEE